MRRRMYLLVVAVLFAHLGATLTGAWRASQPRLQFTHSGKKQHVLFWAFLFMFPLVFQVLVPHTYMQVAGIMYRFTFFSPLFFLCSSINAHTLLCNSCINYRKPFCSCTCLHQPFSFLYCPPSLQPPVFNQSSSSSQVQSVTAVSLAPPCFLLSLWGLTL